VKWHVLMVCVAVTTGTACRTLAGQHQPMVVEATRVLFIGNSYLYHRDIPGILEALADSAGGEKLVVTSVTGPDMALIDHWKARAARREIAKGGWDWVVMQQGPSSAGVSRDTLRLAVGLFAAEISKVKARSAVFFAWPPQNRRRDFSGAIESHSLAAADVQALPLPVAPAWLAAWARVPHVALYDDGLHPSAAGAYLAALVIYAQLLATSPRGLPSTLRVQSGAVISVAPQVAVMLQEAAAEIVAHPAWSRAAAR